MAGPRGSLGGRRSECGGSSSKYRNAVLQAGTTSFAKDFQDKNIPLERRGEGRDGWEKEQLEIFHLCNQTKDDPHSYDPNEDEFGNCSLRKKSTHELMPHMRMGSMPGSPKSKKSASSTCSGIIAEGDHVDESLLETNDFNGSMSDIFGEETEVVPRWERLHMGLTEDYAKQLGVVVASPSPRERLRRRVHADVSPKELVHATQPEELSPLVSHLFPPIVKRKESGMPYGYSSHYDYFAWRCPLQNADLRMKMAKRVHDTKRSDMCRGGGKEFSSTFGGQSSQGRSQNSQSGFGGRGMYRTA